MVLPILFIVLVGGWFILRSTKNSAVEGVSTSTSWYTLSDISSHNNKEDCWTVIEGNVYDVTPFILNHPGGLRILEGCGIDATSLFTGTSPRGRVHSLVAKNMLKKLQIGTLQN